MSELARKPSIPILTCPVHPDRPMVLFRETKRMHIWGCWACKSLPKKKRKLYSGVFVVMKEAGLRVPTSEEIVEHAAAVERHRIAEGRDEQLRHEEVERLAHGFPTEDAERPPGGTP